MILSDTKIIKYLENKKLIITPEPTDNQIQPSSLDLRLDNTFLKFKKDEIDCIDTHKLENIPYDMIEIEEFEPIIIYPHEFMLGQTLEYIVLPCNIVGRVEGRSSIGRLGITVHVTAGYIDPGFEGNITLEITNLSEVPVKLYPYQRVCQIVFETLSGNVKRVYGCDELGSKYQFQNKPTISRLSDDLYL